MGDKSFDINSRRPPNSRNPQPKSGSRREVRGRFGVGRFGRFGVGPNYRFGVRFGVGPN